MRRLADRAEYGRRVHAPSEAPGGPPPYRGNVDYPQGWLARAAELEGVPVTVALACAGSAGA